ncbi:hypothetical protein SAMN05444920_106210 [Nonomuraea solani]|uniref:Uncharacterized protein n=1 Tax=Nonomuraea solani TaxID=1144553 RepID=A0A1H6DSN2_9ACTN|nr:hypothetical protein [Nonomuraea solani]SEG88259.1 hypothetical protein SAMN05444920_106210 [Nonomuraea solani]
MTPAVKTSDCLESHLIDLTDVPLGALWEVNGLEAVIVALREHLTDNAAPLCEGSMAALCGSVPVTAPSTPFATLDQT